MYTPNAADIASAEAGMNQGGGYTPTAADIAQAEDSLSRNINLTPTPSWVTVSPNAPNTDTGTMLQGALQAASNLGEAPADLVARGINKAFGTNFTPPHGDIFAYNPQDANTPAANYGKAATNVLSALVAPQAEFMDGLGAADDAGILSKAWNSAPVANIVNTAANTGIQSGVLGTLNAAPDPNQNPLLTGVKDATSGLLFGAGAGSVGEILKGLIGIPSSLQAAKGAPLDNLVNDVDLNKTPEQQQAAQELYNLSQSKNLGLTTPEMFSDSGLAKQQQDYTTKQYPPINQTYFGINKNINDSAQNIVNELAGNTSTSDITDNALATLNNDYNSNLSVANTKYQNLRDLADKTTVSQEVPIYKTRQVYSDNTDDPFSEGTTAPQSVQVGTKTVESPVMVNPSSHNQLATQKFSELDSMLSSSPVLSQNKDFMDEYNIFKQAANQQPVNYSDAVNLTQAYNKMGTQASNKGNGQLSFFIGKLKNNLENDMLSASKSSDPALYQAHMDAKGFYQDKVAPYYQTQPFNVQKYISDNNNVDTGDFINHLFRKVQNNQDPSDTLSNVYGLFKDHPDIQNQLTLGYLNKAYSQNGKLSAADLANLFGKIGDKSKDVMFNNLPEVRKSLEDLTALKNNYGDIFHYTYNPRTGEKGVGAFFPKTIQFNQLVGAAKKPVATAIDKIKGMGEENAQKIAGSYVDFYNSPEFQNAYLKSMRDPANKQTYFYNAALNSNKLSPAVKNGIAQRMMLNKARETAVSPSPIKTSIISALTAGAGQQQ